MKILYIASAITLPGRSGGATHVREVAEGLAARGHELHVVARGVRQLAELSSWGWRVADRGSLAEPRGAQGGGAAPHPDPLPLWEREEGAPHPDPLSSWATAPHPGPLPRGEGDLSDAHGQSEALSHHHSRITFHASRLPDKLAFLSFRAVEKVARESAAEVVMERYYNFAGAGALVARQLGLPYVLEVNAPMVDPAGSLKSRMDAALLNALRRWAVAQGSQAQRIVTPLATTVPPEIARDKIVELPWGANVERFNPRIREEKAKERERLRGRLGIPQGAIVAAFAGSFRAWHGVRFFAAAAARLRDSHPDVFFLAIGGGPELKSVRESLKQSGARIVFTGPQQHERVPLLLALADVGVAPFVPDTYAPLRTFGFYWSPLKVFEYMAMGLPVVTIDLAPLNRIVRDGREGLLYAPGDLEALAGAIARLGEDRALRGVLGTAARARVVEQFSWAAHCRELERVLEEARRERR